MIPDLVQVRFGVGIPRKRYAIIRLEHARYVVEITETNNKTGNQAGNQKACASHFNRRSVTFAFTRPRLETGSQKSEESLSFPILTSDFFCLLTSKLSTACV